MNTFGSLFSGIGGLDLGLERAGWSCAWQVEIDEFCRNVLAKHWPDVARFEDVRTVGADQLAPVDLIAGGFPCQDISFAGRGEGLDGDRSGLWWEYARIIRELRPRYVLVENSAALLVRGFGDVLGELAALGFDAEWECLPAAAFGAPHIRDRVFIVGILADAAGERRGFRWPRGELSRRSTFDRKGAPPDAHGARQLQPKRRVFKLGRRPRDCGWWSTEPDVVRVVHGLPAGMARGSKGAAIKGLGNAVVPQIAEYIGRCLIEAAR